MTAIKFIKAPLIAIRAHRTSLLSSINKCMLFYRTLNRDTEFSLDLPNSIIRATLS